MGLEILECLRQSLAAVGCLGQGDWLAAVATLDGYLLSLGVHRVFPRRDARQGGNIDVF